jgi:[NiFe] hydrogenase assembly HybE family chaperone
MTDAAGRDDPTTRLMHAYEHIHASRMQGLAFLNAAVRVEAVGFRRWQGAWLGALVTPWSLNLVLTRGDGDDWTPLAAGTERFVDFPAGRFRFIAGHDALAGETHSCSLFSPVLEFADHEAARIAAVAALEALVADPEPPKQAAMSKRDFLAGRFGAHGHVARR